MPLAPQPDFNQQHVIVERQKLGVRGFFTLIFGGLLAGCLSQIVAGTLLVVLIAVAGASLSSAAQTQSTEVVTSGASDEQIALVAIKGIIMHDGPVSETAKVDTVITQLDQVKRDNRVKAVVLDMNTPGGGVTASHDIYLKVKEVAAEKPVVAYFGASTASGGYYIAMAARKIVMNETGLTGSIGVIMQVPVIKGLLDKAGVEVRVFKSGVHKDLGSTTREPTPSDAAIIQGLVDDAFESFVAVVASGRNLNREAVLAVADGRIYTANQALAVTAVVDGSSETIKLVDMKGALTDAIAEAGKLAGVTNPTVIRFKAPGLFASSLSSFTHFAKSLKVEAPSPLMQYIWRPDL